MDESRFLIGTIEAIRVIINSNIQQQYQAQPRQQEWVMSIECICANGMATLPLIIFHSKNLSTQWVLANIHSN